MNLLEGVKVFRRPALMPQEMRSRGITRPGMAFLAAARALLRCRQGLRFGHHYADYVGTFEGLLHSHVPSTATQVVGNGCGLLLLPFFSFLLMPFWGTQQAPEPRTKEARIPESPPHYHGAPSPPYTQPQNTEVRICSSTRLVFGPMPSWRGFMSTIAHEVPRSPARRTA